MKSLSFFSAVFLYLLLASSFVFVEAVNKLVVDCDNKLRKATHCANGSLYGITETIPSEADYMTLVDDLHPFVMRNPPRGRMGDQHPFGGAIEVARRLSRTPGALVSVILTDFLPYWPYQFPGMQKWLDLVRQFIRDKKASGLTNWYGYEIWNEAENTWRDSNGYSFFELWKETYKVIREMDPDEKIIGPCDGLYTEDRMRPFLQFCKDNDVMPDIMCWHELMGVELIPRRHKAYRELERSLGIKELPITINEYCDVEHELEGQPGSSARFIGKFERYKIDSAMITWWFVPQPGRLGSLMATDTQRGAGWYFYKWYGDMTGDMVNVTPPKDDSNLVDGAACVDAQQKYVSFIFGGPNDGNINAVFKNLPSFVGSNPTVKIEKVDWKNKDTPSNGPNTISEKKYNVSNGQLTINVPGTNASSGYRILITGDGSTNTGGNNEPVEPQPSNSVVASGGIYKLINRNSGKALSVNNDSTSNAANVQQWTDSGKTSQQWIITDEGYGYKIMNVNANKALDVNENSTENGGNVIIWSDNSNLNQRWYIEEIGDGYVTLQNINSGLLLDVEKASTSDGGNVLQWASNGNGNQQWKLVRVDAPATTTIKTTTTKPASQPTSGDASCSANILKQGYKCCPSGCVVVFTDSDGTWGVNNDEWCGCNAEKASSNCPSSITSLGYPCCSDNNCNVYATDESGKWGIENDQWCGISNKC